MQSSKNLSVKGMKKNMRVVVCGSNKVKMIGMEGKNRIRQSSSFASDSDEVMTVVDSCITTVNRTMMEG